MIRHFPCIAVLLFVTSAAAQEVAAPNQNKWYGALAGQWLVPRDYDGDGQEWKTYNGYGFYGAVGHRFAPSWRAEAEVGYGKVENDRISAGNSSSKVDGYIRYYSATGALYYDMPWQYHGRPYVGAGAGIVHQRNDRTPVTVDGRAFPAGDSSTDPTAFAELGYSIDIGNALELVPAYRYQWIDDNADGFDDSGIHTLRLALRYWLN